MVVPSTATSRPRVGPVQLDMRHERVRGDRQPRDARDNHDHEVRQQRQAQVLEDSCDLLERSDEDERANRNARDERPQRRRASRFGRRHQRVRGAGATQGAGWARCSRGARPLARGAERSSIAS
jgi:hypothetical protein